MLLSGAMAGLVGLPQLLGEDHAYSDRLPGRPRASPASPSRCSAATHPVGIAFAALLFAFLDRSGPSLQRVDIPPSIVVDHPGRDRAVGRHRLRGRAPHARRAPRSAGSAPARGRRTPPAAHPDGGGADVSSQAVTPTGRRPATAPRRLALAPRRVSIAGVVGLRRAVHHAARLGPGRPDHHRHRAGRAGPRRPDRAGRPRRPGRERAGVVNIGLEGMMILGTWGAGFGRLPVGPVGRALVGGLLGGALGGLLHAVATVTFGVDHIVSGVAINLLAAGARPVPVRAALRRRSAGGGADPVAADQRAARRRSTCRCSPAAPTCSAGWSRHALVPASPTSPGVLRGLTARRRRLLVDPGVLLVPLDLPASCGAPRSACGCARAARTRRRPSRSA